MIALDRVYGINKIRSAPKRNFIIFGQQIPV